MNYTVIKKLPPLEDLMGLSPLSPQALERIKCDRQEIKAILEGKDKRLLLIVGPCSAWPKEAVLEYAQRLKVLNEEVKHALKLVMRVYIQKPRTTKGWAGPVNQPDPLSAPNIEQGIKYACAMMVQVIEMGLPIADEALLTHSVRGFLGLLSWVAIGARSTENQEHRILASALDCPVGLKNPTHGSLITAVNSIVAAQHAHVAMIDGHEVRTHGNPHAHLVLRGSDQMANYSVAHLEEVKGYMQQHDIVNASVLIDASHDNCVVQGKKMPELQPKIIFDVLERIQHRPDLRALVKGFMVESFIQVGNQQVELSKQLDLNGLSITDPCLGWEDTAQFLRQLTAYHRGQMS